MIAVFKKVDWINLKINLKVIDWGPTLGSLVMLAAGFIFSGNIIRQGGQEHLDQRVIETILPILFGLQSAFLIEHGSDPPLELLLSLPISTPFLFVERLLLLLGLYFAAAISGYIFDSFLYGGENFWVAFLRWFSASMFIGGAAAFTSQLTRQGVFGALLAVLMWAGMLFGMNSLLTRFPFLWPLHVYLQPSALPVHLYIVNRFSLILGGAMLFAFAAKLSGMSERVMGLESRIR